MSTTNGRRILLAGCGDLGTRLGLRLVGQGHDVIGLRRRVADLPDVFKTISMDLSRFGTPGHSIADNSVRNDSTVRHGRRLNHQRWTNRVHRDDLVRGLERMALAPVVPDLVHAVDSLPAQMGEVAAFIAERLGVPVPGHVEDEGPGGRRIDGTRFRSLVGDLSFPTYRDGFASMLTEGC